MENYIHVDAIVEAYGAANVNIDLGSALGEFDDVPLAIAQAVHAADAAAGPWPGDDTEKGLKKISRAKAFLNNQAMEKMNAARFQATDPNDEVLGWLNSIGEMLRQVE